MFLRRVLFIGLVMLAGLMAGTVPAFASVPAGTVATALTTSLYYVEPDQPDFNDTAGASLAAQLQKNDGVKLALVSNDTVAQYGGSPLEYAKQVVEQYPHDAQTNAIILVVVTPAKVDVYSSALAESVAQDLMNRARSVSVDWHDTVVTFIQNLHEWEQKHPEFSVVPSDAAKTRTNTGSSAPTMWIVIGIGLVVMAAAAIVVEIRRTQDSLDQVTRSFNAMRDTVDDDEMKHTLSKIVSEVGRYQKARRSRKTRQGNFSKEGKKLLLQKLQVGLDVAAKYVEIQNEPDYYDNPSKLLSDGQKSLESLANAVAQVVREDPNFDLESFYTKVEFLNLSSSS